MEGGGEIKVSGREKETGGRNEMIGGGKKKDEYMNIGMEMLADLSYHTKSSLISVKPTEF